VTLWASVRIMERDLDDVALCSLEAAA